MHPLRLSCAPLRAPLTPPLAPRGRVVVVARRTRRARVGLIQLLLGLVLVVLIALAARPAAVAVVEAAVRVGVRSVAPGDALAGRARRGGLRCARVADEAVELRIYRREQLLFASSEADSYAICTSVLVLFMNFQPDWYMSCCPSMLPSVCLCY
jgi:hypothetical protein